MTSSRRFRPNRSEGVAHEWTTRLLWTWRPETALERPTLSVQLEGTLPRKPIPMAYVDGFLAPLSRRKIAAYRRLARLAGKVWREHGALEYRECIGDDLKIKGMASFLKRAGAKSGETVVFSWVVYQSKAHRDRVVAKVMSDP